jgi:hypothetical protein
MAIRANREELHTAAAMASSSLTQDWGDRCPNQFPAAVQQGPIEQKSNSTTASFQRWPFRHFADLPSGPKRKADAALTTPVIRRATIVD